MILNVLKNLQKLRKNTFTKIWRKLNLRSDIQVLNLQIVNDSLQKTYCYYIKSEEFNAEFNEDSSVLRSGIQNNL